MAIINVKDIKPGMILSEDASYVNGRVLLKAGAELNENHIKIFKTWGISSLNIKQEDHAEITQKRHSRKEISEAINIKRMSFQYCDLNHPFMNALFRASIKVYLEQQDENN